MFEEILNMIFNNQPLAEPLAVDIIQNSNHTINLTATGKAPFTYRLLIDGVLINTATSSTYQSFQWQANVSIGTHTIRGEMTDSCSPSKSTFIEKQINVISLPPPPIIKYNIIIKTPTGHGKVQENNNPPIPPGQVDPNTVIFSKYYDKNTNVTFTAIPDPGWHFYIWVNENTSLSIETPTFGVSVNSDVVYRLYFEQDCPVTNCDFTLMSP